MSLYTYDVGEMVIPTYLLELGGRYSDEDCYFFKIKGIKTDYGGTVSNRLSMNALKECIYRGFLTDGVYNLLKDEGVTDDQLVELCCCFMKNIYKKAIEDQKDIIDCMKTMWGGTGPPPGMSDEEVELMSKTISDYISYGSKGFNMKLQLWQNKRSQITKPFHKYIGKRYAQTLKRFMKYVRECPVTTEEFVVFRGGQWCEGQKGSECETYEDELIGGMRSFSYSKNVAVGFGFKYGSIIILRVPSGSHILPIGMSMGLTYESEVLIPHDTILTPTKVYDMDFYYQHDRKVRSLKVIEATISFQPDYNSSDYHDSLGL